MERRRLSTGAVQVERQQLATGTIKVERQRQRRHGHGPPPPSLPEHRLPYSFQCKADVQHLVDLCLIQIGSTDSRLYLLFDKLQALADLPTPASSSWELSYYLHYYMPDLLSPQF